MSQSIAIPGFVHERINDIVHISKVQNPGKVVSKKRQRITMYRTRSFLRYSMSRAVRAKQKRRPLLFSSVKVKEKALYRRNKRFPRLLQSTFARQQEVQQQTLNETVKTESAKQSLFLNTHIWHVKRFFMMEQNGWRIPSRHRNRGLKAVDGLLDKCVLQDISYQLAAKHTTTDSTPCTIQLTGPIAAVEEFVQHFTEPNLQLFSHEEDEKEPRLLEANEREVTLFQADCFPNSCIGPANFLFIPSIGKDSTDIQIWVSCHPTIAQEVHSQFIAKSNKCKVSLVPPRLNRFSLRGSRAGETLLTLLDDCCADKTNIYLRTLLSVKAISKHCSDGDIFSVSISDPRSKKLEVTEKSLTSTTCASILNSPPGGMSLGSPLFENSASFNFREDHEINEEKHKTKIHNWEALFSTTTPFGAQAPSGAGDPPKTGVCPLILIRKERPARLFKTKPHQLSGWDLLLPAAWAGTLFAALQVRGGATVVGYDEMAHIHAKAGSAYFPRDYLDTPAGREFWHNHQASSLYENSKKPPRKQLLLTPIAELLHQSARVKETVSTDINIDSLLIVRGEAYLRDFRPPAYETLDSAQISLTRKEIEERETENEWTSSHIPKLPPLPPLMFLQVLLVPTSRGLAHDLAELICPTIADVELFIQHKLNFKRKRVVTRNAAEPEAEARLFGQAIHGSLYGHRVGDDYEMSKPEKDNVGVDIMLSKDWEGVRLTAQRAVSTAHLEIENSNEIISKNGSVQMQTDSGDDQICEGRKSQIEMNNLCNVSLSKRRHRTKIKNYFDFDITNGAAEGKRVVIGVVTSGQQAHLNNSHFAVGVCNINALNDMFRRTFGRFEHPQAHFLVLFRNPRSEWLRPAILQIV